MREFDSVFVGYEAARQRLVKVPKENTDQAVSTVRVALPNLIQSVIDTRNEHSLYKVAGSVGEYPLNMAAIPWVAIFRKDVTTGARRGYYVVLLFAEDSRSAVLTLNQGFHDFLKEYKSVSVAEKKARACANFAAEILQVPTGFSRGAIDLKASGGLGRGYQQGAILSKVYPAHAPLDQTQFVADLAVLLDFYEQLYRIAGKSLLALMPPSSSEEFQEAVEAEAAASDEIPDQVTSGPQPKPPKTLRQGQGSYNRDPKIAARALQRSGYSCGLASPDAPHVSFISQRTKHSYVEAHHIVPMSRQDEFEYSLDVEENIIALCPVCHRLLHHGRSQEKTPILRRLLNGRRELLHARGLAVEVETLKRFYAALAEED